MSATLDNFNMTDAYRELAVKLEKAPAGEQGAIRKAFEKLYHVSQHTVYRNLQKVGWKSGRSKRKDAGTTCVDEETLTEIEAVSRLSVRANGKSTMPTTVAVSLLAANGRDINVSVSRLNQLKRARKTTTAQLTQLSAHNKIRSLYPNHVHQIDPSYCLLYYAPCGKEQLVQRFVDESEFYANKPDNLDKIKHLKCWRYVLTDHFSGTIIVRYFQSAGETSANLYEFMLYCWQNLEGRPFRGVPNIMVWDKGSANTASAIKNALRALQIEDIPHKAKNARAKGQVESSNNIVECHFESRLRFEPVNSVEELNQAAEAWYNAWNANLIHRQDTRLKRRGMAEPKVRYDLWQSILRIPEKLRELPPFDVCRYLLRSKPVNRKVDGHLEISFKHPAAKSSLQYSLRNIALVSVGDKVTLSPLYYGQCQIMVTVTDYVGEEYHHVLEPQEYDEAGFALNAPVWGEDIQSMPDTPIDARQKAADSIAYPGKTQEEIVKAKAKQVTPFEAKLDAHSHLKDIKQPNFMKREGRTIDLPGEFQPAPRKPLSRIQVKRLVMDGLGRSLEQHESEILNNYENIFDEDIAGIVEQLLHGDSSPIRLVK
ncbi:DDE-type integrase/transposase/recombinase [Thalassomonas viridans]|uniref:DDE-type integrase/transposase/recombinase n=1 Tax=Thalassomonas viridans TaxID=137584 RepID=A0AAE9Z783_9GAMM|nr:DDE-type integrase/transposase/recombinase [Thalassomonas viridans]WDE07264.1 DDE-type integrase/transposase/recombinase [Thalassomonas viridans]